MNQYTPIPLGAISVFIDNRIKLGVLLPTKDRRNYRCSKQTFDKLKEAIDLEQDVAAISKAWGDTKPYHLRGNPSPHPTKERGNE
jgi:hypothetical protein